LEFVSFCICCISNYKHISWQVFIKEQSTRWHQIKDNPLSWWKILGKVTSLLAQIRFRDFLFQDTCIGVLDDIYVFLWTFLYCFLIRSWLEPVQSLMKSFTLIFWRLWRCMCANSHMDPKIVSRYIYLHWETCKLISSSLRSVPSCNKNGTQCGFILCKYIWHH
jgi:hypothetical protein